jgi:PIN domain nuclease of toxin-antitoxin system
MNRYVTDTHALLWYLLEDPKLSIKAEEIFKQADANVVQIYVPSIVLVEIVYLIEKARILEGVIEQVIDLVTEETENYTLTPITPDMIHAMRTIPYSLIPDMPDRIIAATAKELNIHLITRDRNIREAKVVTVVW